MIITTVSGTDTLDLERVKKHLNIDFAEDDTMLEAYIDVSLLASENYCRDNLLERLNVENIGQFIDGYLPIGLTTDLTYKPLGDVTIKYKVGTVDTTTVVKPLSQYTLDKNHYSYINGYIVIVFVDTVTVDDNADVSIEWNTGLNALEAPIDQARLLLCGTYYENRESAVTGLSVNDLPNGVKFLLEPYMRPQVG